MADLQDAIAELRCLSPKGGWTATTVADNHPRPSPLAVHIATILNAVLSGDLIPTQCCMCGKVGLSVLEGDGGPECQLTDGRWVCSRECWERASGDLILKSDHDLAVAEAIRRAADVGKVVGDGHYGDEVHADILALAPADALAEVQRLREERDRFEAALGRACQVGGTAYLVERAENAAAERDAALARVEKLQLQLDQKDALYDSAYQAGVKVGWNLGVSDDEAGFRAATSSTEHVAELKRIRAALDEDEKPRVKPYMGQIIAECDCPHSDRCARAERCIAAALDEDARHG